MKAGNLSAAKTAALLRSNSSAPSARNEMTCTPLAPCLETNSTPVSRNESVAVPAPGYDHSADTPRSVKATRRSELIARVVHRDLNFAAYVEQQAQGTFLIVVVPHRLKEGQANPSQVCARVTMRDASLVQGVADAPGPSIANGGSVSFRHRLELGDGVSLRDLFSVEVTIDRESYTLFPF